MKFEPKEIGNICSKCGLEVSIEELQPSYGATVSGYRTYCRKCSKAYTKRYYAEIEPPEVKAARIAKHKVWCLENASRLSEKRRENVRRLKAKDPVAFNARAAEYTRKWKEANPERYRENARRAGAERWARNPEKIREKNRRYRAENPERVKAWKQAWRLKNLGKVREAERRKNSERKSAIGPGVSAEEWQAICEKHGFRCFYCLGKLDQSEITLDHFLPISKGGLDAPFNSVPACKSCNCAKHNLLIDVWLPRFEQRGRLASKFWE